MVVGVGTALDDASGMVEGVGVELGGNAAALNDGPLGMVAGVKVALDDGACGRMSSG